MSDEQNDLERHELIRRSDELEQRFVDSPVEEALADLFTYGRRNRALIRRLWMMFALVVVLTVIVGLVGVQAYRNTRALNAVCLAGNESRKQQRDLWLFIVKVTEQNQPQARQRETAAVKAERERTTKVFLDYINTTFAPRDCKRSEPFRVR